MLAPDLTFTQRMLVWSVVVLTLARWVMGGVLDVTPGEALLVEWGRHPGLAGYDGGWGAAFLTLPGTLLFGKTAFGVRCLVPLMAAGATWGLYRLVRGATGEKQAAWAVCLLNLTPVFNHAAVFFRPELVAVCLQLCGMAALWRALRRASAWDWHWALAGLSFGAAIYCWGGAVWGLVSVVVLLAGGRRWRRQLIRPGFWILMADAALLVWPVWDWNVENAMAGVDHWREVLLPVGELGPMQVVRLAGKWVLGLTPLVAAAGVWAFGCGVRRWGSSDSGRYFTAFALTPFAGGLVVSVGGGGQTAWIAPALPALCGLIAWAWEDALADRIVWKQRLQWLTVLPALILTPVAMEPDVLRLAGMGVSPVREASRAWRGWETLSAEVARTVEAAGPQAELDARGGRRLFLIARDERLASVLNFRLPEGLPVRRPGGAYPLVHVPESPVPESAYHFWPRYDAVSGGRSYFAGCTALYITDDDRRDPPDRIVRAFGSWRVLSVFDVTSRGQKLRRVRVFACYGYSGIPE